MIILHDFFTQKGGGENLIISIAQKYNSKIYTLLNKSYPNLDNIHVFRLTKFFQIFSKSLFFLISCFFIKIKTKETLVFSGNYLIFSIWRCVSPKIIIYHHSLPKSVFSEKYIGFNRNLINFLIKKPILALLKFNLSKVDIIYFNSEKSKVKFTDLIELDPKKTKLKILYPFSNLELNNSYRKPKDYIVINSRHSEEKNILSVLDLIKDRPEIKCYVTNYGILTKSLQFKFQNYNNIFLCGYLTEEKYSDMLSGAIAIVFPSFDEDFGIAALDAYNSNIPLIIYKNAGFSEILGPKYELYLDNVDLFNSIKLVVGNGSRNYYSSRINFKLEFFKEFDKYN